MEFYFGERIDVQRLAEEHNISQTPITLALNRLCDRGLVTRKGRSGYYVLELDKEEIEEIYDLRCMLEVYTLKSAIENINHDTLRAMKSKWSMYQNIPDGKYEKHMITEMLELDLQFHKFLINSSSHKKTKILYASICDIMGISILVGGDWATAIQEHIDIIDAILESNETKTAKLLNTHIKNGKTYVKKNFTELIPKA